MKKMFSFMAVLVMVAFAAFAQDVAPVAAETVDTGSQGWNIALSVVLLALTAGASFLANFFEIKPDDKPWLKFLKKTINTLALNVSSKAGK